MLYFRYKHRPYRPAEGWYGAQRMRSLPANTKANAARSAGAVDWYDLTPAPDWGRVACDYNYLLITMPFERNMLGVATRTIASNGSAALLRVDPAARAKSSCAR
jgi:hypothetical protein